MLKLEDEKQLEPLAELIEHKITVLEGMKLKMILIMDCEI